MLIFNWFIFACWLVFIVYWLVMAVGAKRTLNRRTWLMGMAVRVLIVMLIFRALRFPGVAQAVLETHRLSINPYMGAAGAVICGLGVAIAIWARTVLGRNWGMPMSQKQDPELVTAGPYAYIRHPIYTGMILIMLGSALGNDLLWFVPLLLFGSYFVYSARQEEKLMLRQFPARYEAYMKRSKMLLPFLY